jgi:hypothetical protein
MEMPCALIVVAAGPSGELQLFVNRNGDEWRVPSARSYTSLMTCEDKDTERHEILYPIESWRTIAGYRCYRLCIMRESEPGQKEPKESGYFSLQTVLMFSNDVLTRAIVTQLVLEKYMR